MFQNMRVTAFTFTRDGAHALFPERLGRRQLLSLELELDGDLLRSILNIRIFIFIIPQSRSSGRRLACFLVNS